MERRGVLCNEKVTVVAVISVLAKSVPGLPVKIS